MIRTSLPIPHHAQVVFHITRPFNRRFRSMRKLREYRLIRLPDNIGQNVQTTTMRHSHNNRVNTQLHRPVNLRTQIRIIIPTNQNISPLPQSHTIAFMPGIKLSHPSNPKRFSVGYFCATKRSNESDHINRSRMTNFSSLEYLYFVGTSILERSQSHSPRSGMWPYSIPIGPPGFAFDSQQGIHIVVRGSDVTYSMFFAGAPRSDVE